MQNDGHVVEQPLKKTRKIVTSQKQRPTNRPDRFIFDVVSPEIMAIGVTRINSGKIAIRVFGVLHVEVRRLTAWQSCFEERQRLIDERIMGVDRSPGASPKRAIA